MPRPANPKNPNDELLVVKVPWNMKKRIRAWAEGKGHRTSAEAIRFLLHAGFAYVANKPAGRDLPPRSEYPYDVIFPEE